MPEFAEGKDELVATIIAGYDHVRAMSAVGLQELAFKAAFGQALTRSEMQAILVGFETLMEVELAGQARRRKQGRDGDRIFIDGSEG